MNYLVQRAYQFQAWYGSETFETLTPVKVELTFCEAKKFLPFIYSY